MPTLDKVLGAIVGSVADARRLADEQTAAIAELYQSNPLLKGLSVPRLRLPEVLIDMPVVIDGHDDGSEGEPEKETAVYNAIRAELAEMERELNLRLPSGFLSSMQTTFKNRVKEQVVTAQSARQVFSEAINTTLVELSRQAPFQSVFAADQRRQLQRRLVARARAAAVKRPALRPSMNVKVTTDEIKNNSDPQNVTRVKISLREEGMEWTEYENEDGTLSQRLIPE